MTLLLLHQSITTVGKQFVFSTGRCFRFQECFHRRNHDLITTANAIQRKRTTTTTTTTTTQSQLPVGSLPHHFDHTKSNKFRYPIGASRDYSHGLVPATVFHCHHFQQQQQQRYLTSSSSSSSSSTTTTTRRTTTTHLDKKDFDYCVDLVQQRDRESYLCGLLLPYEARRAYFAVRAWNVEVASIKDNVSVGRKVGGGAQFADETNNLALKVRMQWWKEALSHIYDGSNSVNHNNNIIHDDDDVVVVSLRTNMAASYRKNPIVRVLEYNVHDKRLTRRFLERLLEAREADLDVKQPTTVQDMIDYADDIFSSLLYLSLEMVNVRDEHADRIAQHAGIGIGLVTALRGARIRLARGECVIPQELLLRLSSSSSSYQFPHDKLYNLDENLCCVDLTPNERQLLQDAIEHIAGLAYVHLSQAQQLQTELQLPKQARPCFLPVVPALHYLSKLEQAKYDIFDDTLLQQDHLTILFLLTRTWWTGVF